MSRMPKAFVVNLDRSPERLALTKQRFAEVGIELVRFPAIDAALNPNLIAESVDQQRFDDFMHRTSLPGEVGCGLSHFALWDMLGESDDDTFLVVEDDTLPARHIGHIPAILDALPDDWELCLLSTIGRRSLWSRVVGEIEIHRFWRPDYISAGYLVNRRLLRHRRHWPPHRRLGFMFDSWRYWYWLHGVVIYNSVPLLVTQDIAIGSTIDGGAVVRKKGRRGVKAALRSYWVRLVMYPQAYARGMLTWLRLRGR